MPKTISRCSGNNCWMNESMNEWVLLTTLEENWILSHSLKISKCRKAKWLAKGHKNCPKDTCSREDSTVVPEVYPSLGESHKLFCFPTNLRLFLHCGSLGPNSKNGKEYTSAQGTCLLRSPQNFNINYLENKQNMYLSAKLCKCERLHWRKKCVFM